MHRKLFLNHLDFTTIAIPLLANGATDITNGATKAINGAAEVTNGATKVTNGAMETSMAIALTIE